MILPQGHRILVKVVPNARKTEILDYDEAAKILTVAVAAKAEDNKANLELIKFMSRAKGSIARIKTGLKSKLKLIEFN